MGKPYMMQASILFRVDNFKTPKTFGRRHTSSFIPELSYMQEKHM
jgi:hypothetical protein